MKLLHKILFWSHLLAGVVAGIVILIMSFTGVILMYESQITEYMERGVRRVIPSADGKRLSYDDLIAKVRKANPEARPAMIMVKSDATASVAVNLGRENTVFVNPYNGQLLGGLSATHDFMHDVVDWHRWLGTEGEGRATARAITGACNLAFFWLAVSGVYLWWPRSWHWRGVKMSLVFVGRLRGKARDWNWHNVIGFWSSAVLITLTLTAAVMSYPWANDLLYTLTGSEPPPRRAEGPGGDGPAARGRGQRGEARAAAPMASFDILMARAQEQVPGWVMIMLRFQPRGDGPVTASILGPDAFHPFQRSQLTLSRATGDVMKWEPYASNSTGRKLRTWVRALHTGEAFGFAGQTVAGLASLGGCFLVWTGLAMAWRRFRSWRRIPKETISEESVMRVNSAHNGFANSRPPEPEIVKSAVSQAWSEVQVTQPNGANGHARAVQDVARECAAASANGESVLILYGTVTGNSETLAKKLADALRSTGLSARVQDMAHCQPDMLKQANCVLVVASTYGDGEPPDDAAPFCQAIIHGNGLDLTSVKYSVLALGNTTYDHFCKCGRDLDAALERHGAVRIYPRVDCDVDYDGPARYWMEGVLATLRQDRNHFASAS
jgi:uncharacterized iron-regulated membrane protein/flavodoxin